MFLGLEVSLATLFTKEGRSKEFLATIHVTPESLVKKVFSLVPSTASYTSSTHGSFETNFSIFICSFIIQVIDSTDVPGYKLLTLLQKI
mmetsp:Transcript_11794/g.19594  ORF Transcript_11794/g.19594 Transcript_11794/m.19594 type:complete len:89 (-) Transcript_11794:256-522(-)